MLDFDLIAQTNIAGIRGIQISPLGEPGGNVAPTITASPNPASAVAGQTTMVDLTTNDANGDAVTTSITSNPGFAALVGGELQLTPDAGDVAGSPHTVTVQASDGDLSSTVNVTVNVTDGNHAHLSGEHGWCDGGRDRWWSELVGDHGRGDVDPGSDPERRRDGSDHEHQHLCSVDRGVPNALYQSTLHTPTGTRAGTGQLNFDFNVPSGDYEVKLFFGENSTAITGAGQRLFDVNLEGGALEVDNHDIWATVGR